MSAQKSKTKRNSSRPANATIGTGSFKSWHEGKTTLEYQSWNNMLLRCYSKAYHKARPKAIDCSVCDEWLDFQVFAAWFTSSKYSSLGYVLDKDLLVPGNKIYSADTCLFIPQDINTLIADVNKKNNTLPLGVSFVHDRYRAALSMRGRFKHIGYYDCMYEAFDAYVVAKEAYVKQMAIDWQDRIDSCAFDALMRWQVPVFDQLVIGDAV